MPLRSEPLHLTPAAVAAALGGTASGNRVTAPGPGHSAADRSLSVLLSPTAPDGFVVHSFAGDDPLAAKDYVRERLGLRIGTRVLVPAASDSQAESDNVSRALSIWQNSVEPQDTPVQTYLASRGLPMPEDVRWHPSCPFGPSRTGAMVALIRNDLTGEPQGIHRTALTVDGRKHEVAGNDRLSLGQTKAGAVRLAAGSSRRLGIGEGIETSLSLSLLPGFKDLAIWAVVSAGGVGAFPVIPEIDEVVIAVDNDEAGRGAAAAAIRRWRPSGRRLVTVMSTTAGRDLNDEIRSPSGPSVSVESMDPVDGHGGDGGAGNGGPPRTRFALLPFDALKVDGGSPYLVKGLIPAIGLTVVWGPPKCGKSFWVFDLMLRCAAGWDYRGRRTSKGAVVYCAFEGAQGFKSRAAAFRSRFLAAQVDPIPLYLMATPMQLVADQQELVSSIREQLPSGENISAVVLDTLNRSLTGSESSDEDMGNYVKAADAIRDACNCAVIVVHHCGVDGTRPRGHTSLTGAADAQLSVRRDATKNIVVTVEAMKDGAEGETIVSVLETVDVGFDADGDPITSCVVVEAADQAPSTERSKVSGAAKVAYDLLAKALAEAGEMAPPSNHIPQGKRIVQLSLWRSYCDAGMASSSSKPDSKRRAFDRHVEKLQSIGLIGVWNDFVWRSDSVGQVRTTLGH